jgi:hypothetical protein
VLLEQPDHAFKVRIARAEAAGEPVSAARRDGLTVGHHVELTGLAGRQNRVDIETLLDEGSETRCLGRVVLSRGTVVNLDLHFDATFIRDDSIAARHRCRP